jgi:hypothetical protein
MLEEEADERHQLLLEEYADKFEKYQIELKAWEGKYKSGKAKLEDKHSEPQVPKQKEFITKDATIEGLIELLKDNDILNVQDNYFPF